MSFDLTSYLARIGLSADDMVTTHTSLAKVMEGHSRSIPFENVDVVLKKTISIERDDVFSKLVIAKRGGYCFEQNILLQCALEAAGWKVTPLLCRVRWGKEPTQETAFTHVCLQVEGPASMGGGKWLVDVGFAGTNSICPVDLTKVGEPQSLVDGIFRTTNANGYDVLSMQDKDDVSKWRDLYTWAESGCLYPDLQQSNWFSCTFAGARFTNQFFASILAGEEKRHILNNEYIVRSIDGTVKEKVAVTSVDQLVELLSSKFGLLLEKDEALGRYLSKL